MQAQIVVLLRALQNEHGLTYLFVSYGLKVIRALADDVLPAFSGIGFFRIACKVLPNGPDRMAANQRC